MSREQKFEFQSSSVVLTSEKLAILSSEWLHRLYYMAERADDSEILQLLEELPECHTEIAEAIAQQVREFHFDDILQVLDRMINHNDFYIFNQQSFLESLITAYSSHFLI